MNFFINGRPTSLSDCIDDDLTRAVINSLFCWRRALPDDELPGDSRFGWWGDTFEENDRFGSRLWLLSRAKLTDQTVLEAREYALEALQWLLDDGVASQVEVTTERKGVDRLDLLIEIVKPNDVTLSLRFQHLWSILNVNSTTNT